MKTKILVCSLLMTVVGIVACSQQDDAVSEKSKMEQDTDNSSCGFADPEMEKLNSSILELQADVFGRIDQTRVIPPEDILITILRDILGITWKYDYYGDTSCTVGSISSLFSFKKVWEQVLYLGGTAVMLSPINSGADSDSVIVEQNAYMTFTDSVGYYHNVILAEAYNLYGDSLFSMRLANVVDVIDSIAATITGAAASDCQKEEFMAFIANMEKAHDSATSFSDFCTRVKAKYPDNSDQITVLQTYVSGLRAGATPAAKRAYTQQVLSQINTLISDTDVRRALRAGVNTGFASDKLWNL